MINFNKYYLKQSTSYYYFNKNYAIILKVAVEILLFERIFVNPILLLFIMSILIIYSIVILIKSNIIICGIFNETTNSLLAKMYLLYIYSSLTNYCNTTILNLSKINMGVLIKLFRDLLRFSLIKKLRINHPDLISNTI